MLRLCVVLLAVIFTASMLTGCGQQGVAKKQEAPMDKAAQSAIADKKIEPEAVVVLPEAPVPAPVEDVKAAVEAVVAPESQPAPVVSEAPKPSEILMLADFDSGEKPNNVGGNFGAWNKDPSDQTQWCREGFDNVTRHGDKGFAMKLDYSVDSPNPAYNGFWMMLPNIDGSKYDILNMWVKGDSQVGYTTVFKIELKNAARQVGRYYVSNVSDQWQEVSIPLSDFKSLIDKTNLTEFVIVFEDRMATNKKGVIFVDDISLSKK